MLLLYRKDTCQPFSFFFIYIPLCFYFIADHFSTPRTDSSFTFHYASTLSRSGIPKATGLLIYIPLCFYFIRPESMERLLQPGIYIPLCFYFIRRFAVVNNRTGFIYIPLCFYFITFRPSSLRLASKFTFHYASTLSVKTRSGNVGLFVFTFHYASTLSYCNSASRLLFTYLHSIMLLLYQIHCHRKISRYKFTFHYASTLSQKGTSPGTGC